MRFGYFLFDIHDVAQTTHCELDWCFSHLGEDFSPAKLDENQRTFFYLIATEKMKKLTLGFFDILIQSRVISLILLRIGVFFTCRIFRCVPKISETKF